MAPSNNDYDDRIIRVANRTFTIDEARQFERDMLNLPTGRIRYRWIDTRTKLPINFTY